MTYYIAPRFLDKIAVHITKNFLDLPRVKVPLILGIHGRKGEGKTFQCELAYQRLGIEVVHISGGEMESPDAGDPARMLRLRYREAAELIRVRGKMTVLMINDLDAGAGRFDSTTQYTVNTQLVNNTLMNIADNPTNVQLPGSYDEKPIRRVPIIVTGNDFSTLYAPLIRDGRMEKFYWEPNRDDKIGIVNGIFAPDGLPKQDVVTLVDTFIGQAIDFFGALRSRIYDDLVRQFVYDTGLDNLSMRVVNHPDGTPKLPNPNFSLERLLEAGHQIEQEQNWVKEMRLAREYNAALQERQGHEFTIREDNRPGIQQGEAVPINRGRGNGSRQRYADYGRDRANGNNGGNGQSQFSQSQDSRGGYGADSSFRSQADVSVQRPGGASTLDAETIEQVRQLLAQGNRIGLEFVDERRFRMNSWKSCAVLQTANPSEAIQSLQQCLEDHPQDYVRLIGINPANKQRVMEKIIQRP
jgi:ribulose bisphosphate carboxylase small subunit